MKSVEEFIVPNIMEILRESPGKRFTITELQNELQRRGFPYHYQTVAKYTLIGFALKKFKMENYGSVRVVWADEKV
jgi:hypothetical protein